MKSTAILKTLLQVAITLLVVLIAFLLTRAL